MPSAIGSRPIAARPERRLARARLADETDDLAGVDLQVDVLGGAERGDAAALGIVDRDVFERQHRRAGLDDLLGRLGGALADRGDRRNDLAVALDDGVLDGDSSSTPSPRWGTAASSCCVYGCCGAWKICSTVPDSTTTPFFITMMRSARSATTPMSCVIRMIAESRRLWRLRSRSRTSACTVTSSAVVGSSAISSSGSHEIDCAIIARWRWPPESWCGYLLKDCSGFGISTRRRSSIARSLASDGAMPRSCERSASMIWKPIV